MGEIYRGRHLAPGRCGDILFGVFVGGVGCFAAGSGITIPLIPLAS
jgi:hypothetical protein